MDYYFLGDEELVTAFRFVGIEGLHINSAGGAQEAFRHITGSPDDTAGTIQDGFCRVLILTEEVADWIGDALIQWQLMDRYPLIVEIPGFLGRFPGRKSLVDLIREAIGVRI